LEMWPNKEKEDAYKIFVRKTLLKHSLGRSRRRLGLSRILERLYIVSSQFVVNICDFGCDIYEV